MGRMRRRLWVFFCFSLISLGQAYPISFAYSLGQENGCACQRMGRECMHGCMTKKGRHACCHHAMSKIQGGHEDKQPGYAAIPCGGKSRDQALSFNADPFLPAGDRSIFTPLERSELLEFLFISNSFISSPQTPPPKVS